MLVTRKGKEHKATTSNEDNVVTWTTCHVGTTGELWILQGPRSRLPGPGSKPERMYVTHTATVLYKKCARYVQIKDRRFEILPTHATPHTRYPYTVADSVVIRFCNIRCIVSQNSKTLFTARKYYPSSNLHHSAEC